jgi:hypothetical protein
LNRDDIFFLFEPKLFMVVRQELNSKSNFGSPYKVEAAQ